MQDKTRCALTSKLIQYLYENPEQAAIVGPYSNARRVASAVAAFNRARGRGYAIKLRQHKVLVIDPETGKTDIMWEVQLKVAWSQPLLPMKKRGRKPKGEGDA